MKNIHLIFYSVLISSFTWANNINVTNVSLENLNESEGWVHVQCDISWDNSWRVDAGPSNWDAAWVFIKYSVNGGPWLHASINPTESTIDSAFNLDVSSDNLGAFVYHNSIYSGDSDINNINFQWEYATHRIADNFNASFISVTDIIEVKVFAIEMVYVPEGAFYVGSPGGTEIDAFKKGNNTAFNGLPYLIDSEDEITVGTNSTDLYYTNSSGFTGDQLGPIPADFPKGFNAFYCMKYEISEQQYVEYFNLMPESLKQNGSFDVSAQKGTDDVVNRNTISYLGPGSIATTDAPDRACSFMNQLAHIYYLNWSALRPMTELEYEKASRGPGYPVAEVYAWGTTSINTTPHTICASGFTQEYICSLTSNIGNAAYNITDGTTDGPLRCGIFAHPYPINVLKTREDSGSSFYGIMELSGNLKERVVSVGYDTGRNYNGEHGLGRANAIPSTMIGTLTVGIRGGSWNDDATELRMANRTYGGGSSGLSLGQNDVGGRGVRSAE